MDLDAIIRLMERAEQSAFTKIEVQQGDLRILLERGAVVCAEPSVVLSQPKQSAAIQPEEKDAVRSPISGVFYLAKEPGAEPFVQVGSKVKKITAINGAVGMGAGVARVNGKKVCSCEFMFAIKDPD